MTGWIDVTSSWSHPFSPLLVTWEYCPDGARTRQEAERCWRSHGELILIKTGGEWGRCGLCPFNNKKRQITAEKDMYICFKVWLQWRDYFSKGAAESVWFKWKKLFVVCVLPVRWCKRVHVRVCAHVSVMWLRVGTIVAPPKNSRLSWASDQWYFALSSTFHSKCKWLIVNIAKKVMFSRWQVTCWWMCALCFDITWPDCSLWHRWLLFTD